MIKPIGKVLVECGVITRMDISRALVRQRSGGSAKRMGDILLEMGLVTDEQLKAALEEQHGSTPSRAVRSGGQPFALQTSLSSPQLHGSRDKENHVAGPKQKHGLSPAQANPARHF